MSLFVTDSNCERSVASHSMMNGRSWLFALHLFCPATVLSMSELCPDARVGPAVGTDGMEPPQAPRRIPARTSGAIRDRCMVRILRSHAAKSPLLFGLMRVREGRTM